MAAVTETRASARLLRSPGEAHFMSMNAHAWVYQLRPSWPLRIDAGRPSEAKNCAPPRVAVMRPARKDSASFRVLKVCWRDEPATCHL
jgi:hypothetical protein